MAALCRTILIPARNPYEGQRAADLDPDDLEDLSDRRWAPVVFSVACYDTSAYDLRPSIDVVVELDDGCDTHGPVYELAIFTLGPTAEVQATAGDGRLATRPPAQVPRVPWAWLSDEVQAWVGQLAANWWAWCACPGTYRGARSVSRSYGGGR